MTAKTKKFKAPYSLYKSSSALQVVIKESDNRREGYVEFTTAPKQEGSDMTYLWKEKKIVFAMNLGNIGQAIEVIDNCLALSKEIDYCYATGDIDRANQLIELFKPENRNQGADINLEKSKKHYRFVIFHDTAKANPNYTGPRKKAQLYRSPGNDGFFWEISGNSVNGENCFYKIIISDIEARVLKKLLEDCLILCMGWLDKDNTPYTQSNEEYSYETNN